MRKRRLGRTELQVSELGIGGLGIISKVHPDIRSGMAVVEHALDRGMNFIDTARGYFDAEKVIGEVLKTRREGVILASKTYLRSGSRAYRDLETSLETLGVQKIDLYRSTTSSTSPSSSRSWPREAPSRPWNWPARRA